MENKKTETMHIILIQRYAYDFLILTENGKSFQGDHTKASADWGIEKSHRSRSKRW